MIKRVLCIDIKMYNIPDLVLNKWYRAKSHYLSPSLYYVYQDTVAHNGNFIAELPKSCFITLAEFREKRIDSILHS